MRNLIKYIGIGLILAGCFSCEILDPIDENRLTPDYIETDPESAEGVLLHGYTGLISQYAFSEAATDDAVSNQLSNGYKRMGLGMLKSQYNPASRWSKYKQVFYLNKFIDIVNKDSVVWNQDAEINELFKERLLGEAIALRGLYHFYVLQGHAGVDASGNLSGIPYYKEFMGPDEDFNLPRLSFENTISEIMADFDEAIQLLPMDYSDSESDVLPKHTDIDFSKYKVVNGAQYNLRISGRIIKGLKARLALFAASPSFLNGAGYYEQAADISSELINMIGGVSGLVSNGVEFYKKDSDKDSGEFLWRGSLEGNSSSKEADNLPPSVNGKGKINPSHNLVSAFPMKSGLPATDAHGYDPQNPYANRDPRLEKYIVFNGSSIGGGTINTGFGGGVDRVDSITQLSTNTGYYLKKLLHPDVRINDDGSKVGKKHFKVYFRYTELFLILAEAANEIGGPTYAVNGISAYDVMAAIRERAGIDQPDAHLQSLISDKDGMRELIRNERRLELCFEGHRFWDMRRWGMPLNETVTGYFYNGSGYVELPAVEIRNYPSHATYMPIPYSEVLKFSELEQNQGW